MNEVKVGLEFERRSNEVVKVVSLIIIVEKILFFEVELHFGFSYTTYISGFSLKSWKKRGPLYKKKKSLKREEAVRC